MPIVDENSLPAIGSAADPSSAVTRRLLGTGVGRAVRRGGSSVRDELASTSPTQPAAGRAWAGGGRSPVVEHL